ncbi:tobH protein [Antrihabitans sp. YC2-6]|uniref:tobH protein n=1 Tax=Antrihabitans sp. YC2-6 TaxID=2799498 RepID=UPI0018F58B13|nr:tobH protein [Antrihabitans sp. YC2-6]MBJ8347312.1 tobH protein [Antrihabitans sp. YC2-6]
MIAPSPVLDLDDVDSLVAADSNGALRAAALGGAQVRATAAAVNEDALVRLADMRPRSVLLVAGSGRASRAASLLVAAVGGQSGLPVLHLGETPPWVGPLDVVLVAGDDAADPKLTESVDRALRRGAEVVIAAPDEGPLRAAGAGRASSLPPRVRVPDHNTLLRYLAIGVAVLTAVDKARSGSVMPDLDALADVLDAEAARDRPGNEVFHNPAKALAARMQNRDVVLAGDASATAELARHASEVLLRSAGSVATAADLGDVLAAAGKLAGPTRTGAVDYDPFFHDEQLDGPAPRDVVRVFVLSTEADRMLAERRIAALPDAQLVTVDIADLEQTGPEVPPANRSSNGLEQLAVLALRLEMAAAYLALVSGHGSVGRHDTETV